MIRKHYSTLSNRLVFTYSIVFAAVLFVAAVLGFRFIISTSLATSLLNQKELANQTVIKVESYLDEIDAKATQVMSDSRIISTFGKLKEDSDPANYFDKNILDRIDTGSVLTSINGPSSPIWRISVYNKFGDFISSGALIDERKTKNALVHLDVTAEMEKLLSRTDKIYITAPKTDRWSDIYSSQYVSVNRPLMNIYSKDVLGIVEVQQDIHKLTERLGFETAKQVTIRIYNSDGEPVLLQEGKSKDQYYKTSVTSKKYGWTVVLMQTRSVLLAPFRPILKAFGIGMMLVLIVVLIIIYLTAKRLSRPLSQLAKTVREINIANLPSEWNIKESTGEVTALKEAFALMISRINESIIHERKALSLALQSQTNPHFLYNTLSVISAAAMEGADEKIVDICARISSMYRYIADYTETNVKVEEELSHVQNYLELMKERYEDYFNYDIFVRDGVSKISIPKLVIQPLTENCFIHGFKNIEPPYYIRVEAGVTFTSWYIKVLDNGSGMTSEEKEAVKEKVDTASRNLLENYSIEHKSGIGLINSIIRLKLQTQKNVEYSIEDNDPHGTIITIRGELL
jgi:Predicted signal transduction protein with a C-terminal ATPase domain